MQNQNLPPGTLPDNYWVIEPGDRKAIRELGRELNNWLLQITAGKTMPSKIIAGAFDYVTDLMKQRKAILGDNFSLAAELIAERKLGTQLVEPMQDVEPLRVPEHKKEDENPPAIPEGAPGPAGPKEAA